MNILLDVIKNQIKNTYSDDFQEFVEQLFLIRYGNGFIPVKQKRDLGSDGIITDTRTILAVYGPEKRDLKKFKLKVGDDFKKYEDNWKLDYSGWMVVYNQKFTSNELQFLDTLEYDCERIGLDNIVDIISQLSWTQKRSVADFLGISKNYFHNNVLITIVEDLLSKTEGVENPTSYEKPIYIEDKIEINYLPEEVEAAKEEYHDIMLFFGALKTVLSSYKNHEHMILLQKIQRDFKRFSGLFSERLDSMVGFYSQEYPHDDVYSFYVRIVLIFYFERCLIGEKSKAEI